MPRKRFTVEQIINHLREGEVLLSRGQSPSSDAFRFVFTADNSERPDHTNHSSRASLA
jgi:hypothetical protein